MTKRVTTDLITHRRVKYPDPVKRFDTVGLITSLLLLGLPITTVAQGEDAEAARVSGAMYAGVRPGSPSAPPAPDAASVANRPRKRKQARLLTWPGFEQLEERRSRFFFQTSRPVETQSEVIAGAYQIILKNTRVHLRNNRRPLETHWFNTPALRARIDQVGRDVRLTIDLRTVVVPVVRSVAGNGGYFFTFVEFPAGDYLPEDRIHHAIDASGRPVQHSPAPQQPGRTAPDEAESSPPSVAPTRALDPSLLQLDDERPPGM
ncbi:MAG: hypothetical protein AAF355_02230 [Myxococcota bacterium]